VMLKAAAAGDCDNASGHGPMASGGYGGTREQVRGTGMRAPGSVCAGGHAAGVIGRGRARRQRSSACVCLCVGGCVCARTGGLGRGDKSPFAECSRSNTRQRRGFF
jgi:hypothetical protein